MIMFDDMTVFDKMRRRPLPDYYDTMYMDGYKPYEIIEAAHRTMIKQYNARLDAGGQEPTPMNVILNVEVKTK